MLTAADLQQPKGDIDAPVWFPGKTPEDVGTLLDAYIADGVTKLPDTLTGDAAQDAALRSYAMGRAARNVFMRLSATPAAFKLDNEGSQTIISEQIKAFRQMAEKYEAEFGAAVDVEDVGGTTDVEGTGAARNQIVW